MRTLFQSFVAVIALSFNAGADEPKPQPSIRGTASLMREAQSIAWSLHPGERVARPYRPGSSTKARPSPRRFPDERSNQRGTRPV